MCALYFNSDRKWASQEEILLLFVLLNSPILNKLLIRYIILFIEFFYGVQFDKFNSTTQHSCPGCTQKKGIDGQCVAIPSWIKLRTCQIIQKYWVHVTKFRQGLIQSAILKTRSRWVRVWANLSFGETFFGFRSGALEALLVGFVIYVVSFDNGGFNFNLQLFAFPGSILAQAVWDFPVKSSTSSSVHRFEGHLYGSPISLKVV